MVDNEYGVEYDEVHIKRLRIFRTDGQWLVEYQRYPRWIFGLDSWWWFNDGKYVSYTDALDRIQYLQTEGVVRKARFQKVKTFEVEQ